MELFFLYYPKSNIHVIDYGKFMHIFQFTQLTNHQQSYLVDVFSNKKYDYWYMRLLFLMKNKDSILHLVLLIAFMKFDKGKHKYFISKEVSRKTFDIIGIKGYSQIKIEKYDDHLCYEGYAPELLENRLPILYFIFLY